MTSPLLLAAFADLVNPFVRRSEREFIAHHPLEAAEIKLLREEGEGTKEEGGKRKRDTQTGNFAVQTVFFYPLLRSLEFFLRLYTVLC